MGVISPPRFFFRIFLRFFLRFFLREARIPASLSSCYAGRGGKNKTEGLQSFEPKGKVLLGSPGELLSLRRQRRGEGFDGWR